MPAWHVGFTAWWQCTVYSDRWAGGGQEAVMRSIPAALCCAQRRSCSEVLAPTVLSAGLRKGKQGRRKLKRTTPAVCGRRTGKTRLPSGSQFLNPPAADESHPKKAGLSPVTCGQPVKIPQRPNGKGRFPAQRLLQSGY